MELLEVRVVRVRHLKADGRAVVLVGGDHLPNRSDHGRVARGIDEEGHLQAHLFRAAPSRIAPVRRRDEQGVVARIIPGRSVG